MLAAIIDAALRGDLTREQAERLAALGTEAVVLFSLTLNQRVAELQAAAPGPATPSAMVPVYHKPAASKRRRKKKPGAKDGHAGTRRKTPPEIDAREVHRLAACPCCGGVLQRCQRPRTRIIEDIPREITPVVTEHTIHRDYCPGCRKHVEPVVPDAMPNATLGHHVVALSSWFHYGLGVTISQTRDILASPLHATVTAGGLVDAWGRMAAALRPWYEQIAEQLRNTACLHADETGWRVDGTTHWLWCFCDTRTCLYLIDRSRGGPALRRFFTEAFAGTLVSDFWAAYEQVACDDRQYCLVHLLRELEKVDERNRSAAWTAFAKLLRRLLRDGIRLRKRPDFSVEKYRSRILLINRRLNKLADDATGGGHADADVRRLGERISRHRDHLFTFLDKVEVPFENNHAERQVRPAVILRKNILCNRSPGGADTQAVLMSVFRTLKLRGLDPTQTIASALRELLQTGTLPPLPVETVADG
ncbi:MAG: IS66 family transposase [Acidobacteria bacterium]|nr:IS66 family transposase [Acidobacteriota bacterium]